jgi:hypothetical protein
MSRTLYEISQEYQAFTDQLEQYIELIEAGELPEEAVFDTLEAIDAELESKIDNVACVVKSYVALIEALKVEKQNIDRRIKANTAAVDRLKAYMTEAMARAGKSKIESARNVVSFRKSNGVVIEDQGAFVRWAAQERPDLLSFKEPTVSLSDTKKAILAGEIIPFATIAERNNIQIK